MEQEVIERFRSIVGAAHAITDQALIAPYLLEERGLFTEKRHCFYVRLLMQRYRQLCS